MFGWIRSAVERLWGWRSWGFGPETEFFTCTLGVNTSVRWEHFGASVEWYNDAGGRNLFVRLGPLELYVFAAPTKRALRAEAEGKPEPRARIGRRRLARWDVWVWLNWRHVGVSADTARLCDGRAVKVQVGPFGVCVEPGTPSP